MSDDKIILSKCITEYCNAQVQIDSFRELQREIAKRASVDCDITEPLFKKIAAAVYSEKVVDIQHDAITICNITSLLFGDLTQDDADLPDNVTPIKPFSKGSKEEQDE